MRRIAPEVWAGLIMLMLCVVVGLPVLLGAFPILIPYGVWLLLYVLVIGAICVVALGEARARVRVIFLVVALVGGWALLLTARGSGLLDILLLVVIAPLSIGLISWPLIVGVIVLNTIVIVIGQGQTGMPFGQLLTVGAFHLMIQVATTLSLVAIQREQTMRRQLGEAHVELQAASALVDGSARTAERLRISRELHDLLGHQLTLLTLELEAARHRGCAASAEHIDRADGVARRLLRDVRATVSELRQSASVDLADSLRAVGKDLPGLDVSVYVDDDVAVDEEQSVVLVRAIQEIVTNALRHAQARELSILVEQEDGRIRLRAVDDGTGAVQVTPGNGLRGLEERFVQVGGGASFAGTSAEEKGFTVDAWMPTR